MVKVRVSTEWPLESGSGPPYQRVSVRINGTSEATLTQLRRSLLDQIRRCRNEGGVGPEIATPLGVLESGRVRMVVDEDGDHVGDLTLLQDMDRITLVMQCSLPATERPSSPPAA